MVKRIAAIIFIFACTTVAWAVLGSTIFYRTYETDTRLEGQVASIWGAPQSQMPPTASYQRVELLTTETTENGKKKVVTTKTHVTTPLPLDSSRVDVALALEYRQKGLLWYSLYNVTFGGTYVFRNPTSEAQDVTFTLTYPAAQANYDDLTLTLDGQPISPKNEKNFATALARVEAGKSATLRVAYNSRGLSTWTYSFGGEVAQVRDFQLKMKTNFKDIDFPANSMSPSEKRETPDGWELAWNYKNLVTGYNIGMVMPEKLQPGPLAGRISYFAPVSLFFFFFLMFIITTLRGIELHPMNYFFLAAAFFAFHLLLAYLVDHISIHAAFAICSVVSIFLVVSYLRLVVGIRFAAVGAGLAQFIYLVLFSYAFFFKGFTGLAVTIGSILTLFVVMQMTGKIRWAEKFANKTV
ncbi:MAG: inner membrane CreD family protein [Acidobacteria bacterium]|nr:inner membrane CreD family protein [Acidobacteriota bacterium]MCL5288619.1 inner membrane CreD family protein [Acidobacteriota bacterium]